MPFFKQYDQQFDSSIAENPMKRVVFNDLCSLANRDGIVDRGPYESIAATTRWPVNVIVEQMTALQQPDPHSRSNKLDGRRIIQEGVNRWRIVNYVEYRKRRDGEARRTQNKESQQRWRDRQKVKRKPEPADVSETAYVSTESAQVSTDNHKSAQRKQEEADCPGERKPRVSHSKPESAQCRSRLVPPLPPKVLGGNGEGSDPPQTPPRRPFTPRFPLVGESTDGWSVDQRKALRIEFPNATSLPEKFSELPVDIQRVIMLRVKKMRAPA